MKIWFAAITMITSTASFAGQDDVQAATGAGYALVVVEKCTGIAPNPEYIPLLRSAMTNAGMPDEDFRKGFAAGAMRAEMRFRGKPPAKECRDAATLKAAIDKSFL